MHIKVTYWAHFFFFGCTVQHAELPLPEIEPAPPAVEAWSLNHWTTGKVLYWVHLLTVLNLNKDSHPKQNATTSLVAQWLRICLPMQGTWVQCLVREDPTCHGATKPVHHNYWRPRALEPAFRNYWARALQLLKPARLELMLRNKRSHHKWEAPAPQWRVAPARHN